MTHIHHNRINRYRSLLGLAVLIAGLGLLFFVQSTKTLADDIQGGTLNPKVTSSPNRPGPKVPITDNRLAGPTLTYKGYTDEAIEN